MMGKEIRTFEYNGLTTGQHSTIWDGTNNNGVRVSSGVYIYKFRAVSLSGNGKVFEKASKLMLVK